MTLADEDTKSISTDNAKRAIKDNVAMHVRQPGGQLWDQWSISTDNARRKIKEDTNSIMADNAKREIQGIEAMQVM